ncbi:MAG: ABC transporter permease [Solirubrobacterales bacterium]
MTGTAPRALASSVLATAIAFALSLAIVGLSGQPVGEVVGAFAEGAFGDADAVAATLKVMVPLVLIALAWIIASSARQINLGLEGQILVGGIFATVVGLELTELPRLVHLPLAIAAGAVGGGLYAAVPALLARYRDVSELLSTFMLNFVAVLAVSWLVRGPLQNPTSSSLLQTSPVELSASWPRIDQLPLTWDILYVPIAVVALALVMRHTTVGFRLRVLRENEEVARDAGIPTARIEALALIASGAIAGVVGSSLILASVGGSMVDGFSNNYGFLGIAVALLARNSPLGCLASGLLFAALQQGGGLVETRVGVPSSLVDITQGLVLVVLAGAAVLTAPAWLRRLGLRKLSTSERR